MKYFILVFLTAFFLRPVSSQSVGELIDQVSKDGIIQLVRDLSGEDATIVDGHQVTITHRVSSIGNDMAADYIRERLDSYGLDVSAIQYSGKGKNIVAVQEGMVSPENIYIVCGHYDSVDNYGADDNASGTSSVIETARILSQYSFENTIIYALWDEEETGLHGARNYANQAALNGDKIIAVLNMDMMGYDGNGDGQFDIDVRNIAQSNQIKDDLINVVSSHNLNLFSEIVNPGTLASDHAVFWDNGFSAVLLGEAWSVNDITPGYHTANDRINLFNLDYFHEMVKLVVGYAATMGVLLQSTSIKNSDMSTISVYPNPTHGKVDIDLGYESMVSIWVEDIHGRKMHHEELLGQQVTLQLGQYPAGTYIVRVVEKGNTVSQARVVVL